VIYFFGSTKLSAAMLVVQREELIFGTTTATGGRVNFFELRKFLGKQRKMLYNLTPKEGTITQSINRLVYKMDAFEYILISTPSIMFA
jgi:hypothetical protein